MQYLIDTHAFIWYATGNKKLSKTARSIIDSNEVKFISIGSIWEMAIKVNIGKLDFKQPFQKIISDQLKINDYILLNLELKHIFMASNLELHHRDPFDRIIISQAMVEKMPIVSNDDKFDKYEVERIW
ncbi:MAG: type II toxin-antitoxin system VapC family toxin [Bacteroidetes bacterium]|nr:type II toxin-antitoxin system VapC family toxin [Bacteroidota bacterium]